MTEFKQTTLASLPIVRSITNKLGGGTKKSFGQNFLINQNVLLKFIDTLDITKNDTVIEIGPGIGVLTYTLCQKAKKVYLIEIDREKESALNKVLENYDNYEIIWADATDFDFSKQFANIKDILIIGSLPYNVGKKIIYNLFNSEIDWKKASFILQKEVAKNYISKTPHADFLSIFASLYSISKYEFSINRKSFYPIPKVDSATISFTRIEKTENAQSLSKFIKSGFQSPRKTILNNLKTLGFTAEKISSIGIEPRKRPSELSKEDWINLYKLLLQ